MLKRIAGIMIVTSLCLAAVSAAAFADGYYDSNNDEYSHTHHYYDYSYDHEYTSIEPCTWEKDDYAMYDNYGVNGHYYMYTCQYCYGTKKVTEDCDWRYDSRDYENWSSSRHKVTTTYKCSICGNSKDEESYKKHNIKWRRYNNNFWYECKQCGHAPNYNGTPLVDSNDVDNITLRKNKTYKYYMSGYHKGHNKVKSIKISKKKICSAKRKGRNIVIKGRRKGKSKIVVTMRSGAKYTLKVKVK